jgi:hypothetical protein
VKKGLTFSIILFLSLSALAQTPENKRIRILNHSDRSNYLLTYTQAGLHKTLDQGVSPLLYKGAIIGAGLGFRSEKSNRIWDLTGDFNYGTTTTEAKSDFGGFQNYHVSIDAQYLWNLDYQNSYPVKFYAGFATNQTLNFRVNENMFNASFGYDVISGFGVSAFTSKSFNIKGFDINLFRWFARYHPHKITVEYEIDLPILFSYIRPTYVVIENFVDGNIDLYDPERAEFATIGTVFQLKSNLGLSYHLRNQNIIRFGYLWQYYSIDPEYSRVQGATHLFQIQFKFQLNKKSLDHES